ncbi:hypothetical protein GALMADRAFT_246858 [Galerina marginata CBS 339.88]|uniref:Uncharacterized protein n=1 Tax=Galerina marginata (strain CBS 339.88) TaxID=685588 RepID=A0A067T052_GALM3|nr:hypothetical protein GALMADRAFT_246858 [Galerina marginata CBS 339.88]
MAGITASALAALAKQHLGLPSSTPDARVPRFYVDELRRHLALYPDEHQFRITLQPKVGLGSVTCLKGGCNASIPMVKRIRTSDGGKSDGCGSLSAYRSHLLAHAKKTRVKAEPKSGPSSISDSTNTPSLPGTVKAESSSSKPVQATPLAPSTSAVPSRPSVSQNRQVDLRSLTRVKPEAVEAKIPRKRLSDVAFGPLGTDGQDENAPTASQLAKKVKTETIPKTPFAQVTNNPIATGSQMRPLIDPFSDPYNDRMQLDDIRLAIAGQQNVLNRVLSQPYLSLEDMQWATGCERELGRLRALEQEYFASIAGPPPSFSQEIHGQRDFHGRVVDNGYPALFAPEQYPMDRSYMVPAPFPMQMEVDSKPNIQGPSASTSRAAPAPFPVKFEVDEKPLHNAAPVASGSKPPLPFYQHKVAADLDSDTGGDASDSEDDDHIPENPYLDRLGIKIPPPIYDDAHDANGDYHGRGRDLFVGPQASADDIEKFLVQAGNAETFDGNESVDKALQYLGLNSLHDKPPGMEIVLMAHQVMGVAWMLAKERSDLKGGCLADEMGLGKTVQMMACIVQNPSTDPACKTTLILAPVALLDQWKEEIESKTNIGLKCLIYHGQSKTKKKSELMKHDVVLTTFGTMASEWPDYENEMKKKAKAKKRGDSFIVTDSEDEDMKDPSYRKDKRKQQAGILFQVDFYRIVVDEGQNIRNRRTRTSRAITDLRSTYRWCLTGTPIVNTLADVYGLLRFLKIRPWYDWNEFQTKIGMFEKKNPGLAVTRLQTVMTLFLLRRKKDSKLDGKNLIELPEKKVKLVKLEFSEEEREIYNMVEARSQAKFNRYLREGTVLKNYHQVLVLLLRLRQICSHPSLIQEDGVAFVHPDEAKVKPEFATEMTRARRLVSPEFVIKLKEKFLQDARTRMEAEKESANASIEEEDCPICYDAMTDAVVTGCAHIFCRECIIDFLHQPLPDGGDHGCKPDQRPCPVCRSPVSQEVLFSRQAFEPSEKELKPPAEKDEDEDSEMSDIDDYPTNDRKGKGKAAAPKKSGRTRRRAFFESDDEGDDVLKSASEEEDDEDEDMSDFIVESDEDEEEKDARRALKKRLGKKRATIILDSDDEPETPEEKEVIFGVRKKVPAKEKVKLMSRFLPSTKMKYMMDELQKLVKTNPEEKTLLVSQWTGCLQLISDYLTEKGIPHVKYQGDMSRAKRDQAVQVFMSREKARVMLMSLKCGGVGLNLTRANNVISLDLGWSQAVESQAFDRVHRVGQVRNVLVQRVVIADTVEDRILKMQERKQLLADGSLGEGTGQKIGKLSVKELANLFGLDARGRLLKV